MSDTNIEQIVDEVLAQADETAPADEATEVEEKAEKVKAEAHSCLCAFFEVGNFDPALVGTPDEEIFNTGCEQTTQRTFAQGHDARLVAFLVDGHFDGYSLRLVKDGVVEQFETPADAAGKASDSLRVKAEKATASRQAKVEAKQQSATAREEKRAAAKAEKETKAAEKKAERERLAAEKKAEKVATPQAEVVAGSETGDVQPVAEGQTRIKVGRWTYDAVIDEEGVAHYTTGAGDEATVNPDGYITLS